MTLSTFQTLLADAESTGTISLEDWNRLSEHAIATPELFADMLPSIFRLLDQQMLPDDDVDEWTEDWVFRRSKVILELMQPEHLVDPQMTIYVRNNWPIMWRYVDKLAQWYFSDQSNVHPGLHTQVLEALFRAYDTLGTRQSSASTDEVTTTFFLWIMALEPGARSLRLTPEKDVLTKVTSRVYFYLRAFDQGDRLDTLQEYEVATQSLVLQDPDIFIQAALQHLQNAIAPDGKEREMNLLQLLKASTVLKSVHILTQIIINTGGRAPLGDTILLSLRYLLQVTRQPFRRANAAQLLELVALPLRHVALAGQLGNTADYVRLALDHNLLHHIFAARAWLAWGEMGLHAAETGCVAREIIQKIVVPHFTCYSVLRSAVRSIKELVTSDTSLVEQARLGPQTTKVWREMLSTASSYEPMLAATKQEARCAYPLCKRKFGEAKPKLCQRCRLVLYCSTSCQASDWKDYGHKQRCGEVASPVLGVVSKAQGRPVRASTSVWDFELQSHVALQTVRNSSDSVRGLLKAYSHTSPPVVVIDYSEMPPRIEVMPLALVDDGGRANWSGAPVSDAQVRLLVLSGRSVWRNVVIIERP